MTDRWVYNKGNTTDAINGTRTPTLRVPASPWNLVWFLLLNL